MLLRERKIVKSELGDVVSGRSFCYLVDRLVLDRLSNGPGGADGIDWI